MATNYRSVQVQTDFDVSPFQSAEKYQAYLRLGIAGPSGFGKTYTALLLAQQMAKLKGLPMSGVYVIDSENGSASKYKAEFTIDGETFKAVNIGPNAGNEFDSYHPYHYVSLIKWAERDGAHTVIVDSLSHAWAGQPNGVLHIVDQVMAEMSGKKNTWQAWRVATPIHNTLMESIITCNVNLIATMRAKQMYFFDEGDKQVEKVGLDAIQRDSVIYEFDVFGQMIDYNGRPTIKTDKSRCPALQGIVLADWHEMASELVDWLGGKKDPYTYGNGARVPQKGVTRRLFNEYTAAHDGAVPEDGNALKEWYEAHKDTEES